MSEKSTEFTYESLLQEAEKLPWNDRGVLSPQAVSFLKQIFATLAEADGQISGLTQLVQDVHGLWRFGEHRTAGEQIVRFCRHTEGVEPSDQRDCLEIIGEDMAFLVGSVINACRVAKADILTVLHPIVELSRSSEGKRLQDGADIRESYIQVQLAPMSDGRRERVVKSVKDALNDVRLANEDFDAMRAKMLACADQVEADSRFGTETTLEAVAFLRWLADQNFTFLGARDLIFPKDENNEFIAEDPDIEEGSNLGVLRDDERFVLHRGNEPTVITPQISAFLKEPTPIIVAKSNMRSRVHRDVYTDYIGIKRFDDRGEVIGETRFVGLFTSEAFNRMAREVPLVRQKVAAALEYAGRRPGSHDARVLQNILETYPREELFQIDVDTLTRISLGILNLEDHPRSKVFIREDRFDRYVSALVYVPREVYDSNLRARIGETLRAAYDGRLSAFYPNFRDAPLARVHYIIGLNPGHPTPDIAELEQEIIALARTWESSYVTAIDASDLPTETKEEALAFDNGFTAAYREAFSVHEAVLDMSVITGFADDETVSLRAFRNAGDAADTLRAKIYTRKHPIPLSDCVPIFERMGLFVEYETGFPISSQGSPEAGAREEYWIHSLYMRTSDGADLDLDALKQSFEDAFVAVWTGKTESDGFNGLILRLGADWRQAALFRTLASYRHQSGKDPARTAQIRALLTHSAISAKILELFKIRFDPSLTMEMDDRRAKCNELHASILADLENVASLNDDQVLRRIANLVMAVLRTNFFRTDAYGNAKESIALKISSRDVDVIPAPRPFREIFVSAPHVEGVHLRFGPVARGGLRWSDRPDDFRTEVLGLVKAQQVKNAVIVPVGSKGGFVPKKIPMNGTREEVTAEGIRAYRTFISSLLELTDNLVEGGVVHPSDVIIWDDDDPYLVVAADKGTATFSDIANGISEDHGFWLGDAFASGGSAGYDHKKMGITARGGWVAVQRHFREMGVNIQEDRFTVIGVGDMSGDVFGNGMLLSKTIRLVAAFNHLDIFIDPDPQDTEASWNERKRLFDLPRSTWQDYDESLISKGGGVFSRSAKSIDLTPEMQAMIGVEADKLTPNELISALLKAQADLLWFGGIGTYVKARSETHDEAGDKANDGLRVNASDLKVKVVGEGANLGITQAARIEYARLGGRINTDAVDNSAGVDSSDHEVNIKILLADAIRRDSLKAEDRNDLLASMTDAVADHVLANNYNQTAALSNAARTAPRDLDAHERFMERLEARGLLDRAVEGLPNAEDIRGLRETGKGLTRPEISVLLAYAKNSLFDELISSDVPDDPHFMEMLFSYFPEPLRDYAASVESHRLRREIIATYISNRVVNLGGPTFIHRISESAEVDTPTAVRAFEAARVLFRCDELLGDFNGLDNKAPASVQSELKQEMIMVLRRQAFWLARTRSDEATIHEVISRYREGVNALWDGIGSLVSPFERERMASRAGALADSGAPDALAMRAASLRNLSSATDIIDTANSHSVSVLVSARLYHMIGDLVRFDELRAAANDASSPDHWDRLATRRLIEELMHQQARLTGIMMKLNKGALNDQDAMKPDEAQAFVSNWLAKHGEAYDRLMQTINELDQTGNWSFAKLVLVSDSLRAFLGSIEGNAS